MDIMYEIYRIKNSLAALNINWVMILGLFSVGILLYLYYIYTKIKDLIEYFEFKELIKLLLPFLAAALVFMSLKYVNYREELYKSQFDPVIAENAEMLKNNHSQDEGTLTAYVKKKVIIAENSSQDPTYTGYRFSAANYKLPADLRVKNVSEVADVKTIVFITRMENVAHYTGGLSDTIRTYLLYVYDTEKKRLIDIHYCVGNKSHPTSIRASGMEDNIGGVVNYIRYLSQQG